MPRQALSKEPKSKTEHSAISFQLQHGCLRLSWRAAPGLEKKKTQTEATSANKSPLFIHTERGAPRPLSKAQPSVIHIVTEQMSGTRMQMSDAYSTCSGKGFSNCENELLSPRRICSGCVLLKKYIYFGRGGTKAECRTTVWVRPYVTSQTACHFHARVALIFNQMALKRFSNQPQLQEKLHFLSFWNCLR